MFPCAAKTCIYNHSVFSFKINSEIVVVTNFVRVQLYLLSIQLSQQLSVEFSIKEKK